MSAQGQQRLAEFELAQLLEQFRTEDAAVAEGRGKLLAELKFAAMLCELHPRQAASWLPLIRRACATVRDDLRRRRTGMGTTIERVEQLLTPLHAMAKSYTVYCVGHTHIDMNWMWPWQETVAVVSDTFETVLRLMAEFSDLCFSQSQAGVYAIVERYHPELLEEIRRYVSTGRWEPTAGHWVENDKNLVDGESLCRHLLYTRRYLRKMFGAAADAVAIDWACDTFGHAATVPAYLVRGGIKYVYLHRPGAHHPARPPAFWWEAPDGSRVLVRNDMWAGYNGQLASDALLKHLVAFVRETHMPALMYVFGVGDHGGGPTRRDIARAIAMNSWPVFPRVVFSPARSFFERLEQQATHLPVLRTELNCEFTGCYTAQTVIKRANRQAENRLADTECITALCTAAFGRAYPSKAQEEAWQDTLFSQFHDILGGSCTADARAYSQALFQRVMATTSIEQTKALRGRVERRKLEIEYSPAWHRFSKTAAETSAAAAGSAKEGEVKKR